MDVDLQNSCINPVAAETAGLQSYDHACVNGAQPAHEVACCPHGVTDAALCADEPGLCKAELRAMRSLLLRLDK